MTLSTVSRWDKYDGYVGNFRTSLGFDVDLETEANQVLPVGLDSSGFAVVGAGSGGIKGVIIVPVGKDINGVLLDGGINIMTGDICDVGKHGEITNFKLRSADGATLTAATAGASVYGHADGSTSHTAGTDGVYLGHMAEATRLIVNVADDPVTADLRSRVIVLED